MSQNLQLELDPVEEDLTTGQAEALAAFWLGLEPDPVLTAVDWSNRFRFLSEKDSSEPGKYRTARTPYVEKPLEDLSNTSSVETVVLMWAAQTSKTTVGLNWMGYAMDYSPGPMMAVQPTVDMAKRFSRQRVAPMIAETPRLKSKIADSRSRDSGNTILSKEFPGGLLLMTGSNSAAGLRSMPVRYLNLDEIDGYPDDVEGEGDPIELSIARTRTFSRKKILKTSTPTIHGSSKIEKAFEESNQCYYYVPCPHCGHYQHLVWGNLKWKKNKPATVYYQCAECKEKIHEHHKTKMLLEGEWRASNPSATSKITGYHLNGLYSPVGWFSWQEAVEQFLKAKADPEKMRTFVNTVLAETWKEKTMQPDWEKLWLRAQASNLQVGELEPWVLFLTFGADVQKDRIELEVFGWGRGKRNQSIGYYVFQGDTDDGDEESTWGKVKEVIEKNWRHPCGIDLKVYQGAIDAGYNAQVVYDFCRGYSNVVPVRGSDTLKMVVGAPKAVDVNYGGRLIKRGAKYWPVGDGHIKDEMFGWLNQSKKPDGRLPEGWCEFPPYDEEYFKQLTAEAKILKVVKGYRRYVWEKTRERNEAIDTRKYARAAAAIAGMDQMTDDNWSALEESLEVKPEKCEKMQNRSAKKQKSDSVVKPSPFWSK